MTVLIRGVMSKKELATMIGKNIQGKLSDPSIFGSRDTGNGTFVVAHRPLVTGTVTRMNDKGKLVKSREFFANITMENGILKAVK